MTRALTSTRGRAWNATTITLAVAIMLAIIVGAWLAGTTMRPDASDARAERVAAYDSAYDAARDDAYAAAYEPAWQDAFTQGAATGEREGAAAGIAAATKD